jgi:AraC-like DNA-binding protein
MRIYEKIFRCPVLFGQGNNELRINTTWLDEPTRRCNQLTFMAAQKLCAETLDLMDLSDGIAGELRQILMESIGRFPTVETICRRFGMSPRTFRRKLNAEGTSYANLVNDTRANLAKKYLSETMMTVDEIANRIGYSDTSNFRYAFYRKMGITPAEYRRRKDGTVIALD